MFIINLVFTFYRGYVRVCFSSCLEVAICAVDGKPIRLREAFTSRVFLSCLDD